MRRASHHPIAAWIAVATALLVAACASTAVTPSPTVSASPVPAVASPSAALATPPIDTAGPSPDPTGFAFAAEDIAAYYESRGYVCAAPRPSTTASGFTVRQCEETDDAGRIRTVELVTDPGGSLAYARATVKGTKTETILAPIDALEPLSGFLGATLGEDRGVALLTWLASHLGDRRAETMNEQIRVATYTASDLDHSTLSVEVADRTYLDVAPVASP